MPLCQPSAAAIYDMPLMTSLHIRPRRRVPAQASCSTPRRRHAARRRHCAQTDCPTWVAEPHPFDQLPWIAAMDVAPDPLNVADIADLSQLVVDQPEPLSGPIRRRKTSLRSNPLAHDPRTPVSQINPCRVHFDHLMPVFSCNLHARPNAPPLTTLDLA